MNDSLAPSARSKVKSSVQRGLRQKFLDTYPGFEPYIDEVLPKKAQLDAVKLLVFLPLLLSSLYIYILTEKKDQTNAPSTQSPQPPSSTNRKTAPPSRT